MALTPQEAAQLTEEEGNNVQTFESLIDQALKSEYIEGNNVTVDLRNICSSTESILNLPTARELYALVIRYKEAKWHVIVDSIEAQPANTCLQFIGKKKYDNYDD